MIKHDCENCDSRGDCDMEETIVKARAMLKDGKGMTELAALAISLNATPRAFFTGLQAVLVVIGPDPANLALFRKEMDRLAKAQSETFQLCMPVAFQIVFDDIKTQAMARAIAELHGLAAALGVTAGVVGGRVGKDGSFSDVMGASPAEAKAQPAAPSSSTLH